MGIDPFEDARDIMGKKGKDDIDELLDLDLIGNDNFQSYNPEYEVSEILGSDWGLDEITKILKNSNPKANDIHARARHLSKKFIRQDKRARIASLSTHQARLKARQAYDTFNFLGLRPKAGTIGLLLQEMGISVSHSDVKALASKPNKVKEETININPYTTKLSVIQHAKRKGYNVEGLSATKNSLTDILKHLLRQKGVK